MGMGHITYAHSRSPTYLFSHSPTRERAPAFYHNQSLLARSPPNAAHPGQAGIELVERHQLPHRDQVGIALACTQQPI